MKSGKKAVEGKGPSTIPLIDTASGNITYLAVDRNNNVRGVMRKPRGTPYGTAGVMASKMVIPVEVVIAERPTPGFAVETFKIKFAKSECDGELEFDEEYTVNALQKKGTGDRQRMNSMMTTSRQVIRNMTMLSSRAFYIIWKVKGKKEQQVPVEPRADGFVLGWASRVVTDSTNRITWRSTPVVIRPSEEEDDIPSSTMRMMGDIFIAASGTWTEDELLAIYIERECSVGELRGGAESFHSRVPGMKRYTRDPTQSFAEVPMPAPPVFPVQHDTSDGYSNGYQSSLSLAPSSTHTEHDSEEESETRREYEPVVHGDIWIDDEEEETFPPNVIAMTSKDGNLFDDTDEKTFEEIILRTQSNLVKQSQKGAKSKKNKK